MVSEQAVEFIFDNIYIFDWYDGIARAIGIQQQEFYLIMLTAWDIDKSSKAYVLINLDKTIAKEIEMCITETNDVMTKSSRWDAVNLMLERYLSSYLGIVYLTFKEPQLGESFTSQAISPIHARRLLGYSIEKTFSSENIDFWFSLT